MDRWLIWLLPSSIFAYSLLADHLNGEQWGVWLNLSADRLIIAGAFAAVSFLADLAWRTSTDKWPLHKRHFAIFGIMSLFLSVAALFEMQTDSYSADYWLPRVAGIVIGLCIGSFPMLFGSRAASHGWRAGNNARPDASRPLLVVADPHWGTDLVGLHEATFAHPDADWLFLGDVFDVWLGIKGFETDAQRNFLWWVSERRRTGHWVGLWLGNREYFLDDIADKFDFIGEGTGGRLSTEPFIFEHGDLINTKDWKYRFWNLLSRSMPVWVFAKVTPPIIGAKLCSWLEKKLLTTNQENKTSFPMVEFQKAIDAEGAEFFIVGHFHCLKEADKGMSVPWAHEGQMLLWQNGEFRLVGGPTGSA